MTSVKEGNHSFSLRMLKRGFYAYLLTDDCLCLKHLKYYAPQLKVMASITKGIADNTSSKELWNKNTLCIQKNVLLLWLFQVVKTIDSINGLDIQRKENASVHAMTNHKRFSQPIPKQVKPVAITPTENSKVTRKTSGHRLSHEWYCLPL